MESIKDRINKLIKYLNLSKNEFAREIGTSSAMVSKITTKEINFGIDIFQKIISRYTNLNQQWLLTGVGEMWLIKPNLDAKAELNKYQESHRIDNLVREALSLTKGEKILIDDLTSKQMITVDRNREKAKSYFENIEGELSGLFFNINEFCGFAHILDWITDLHFRKLFMLIYNERGYMTGDAFEYDKYKSDIEAELKKLVIYKEPIIKLVSAIMVFYKEFNKIDPNKIIENELNGDYV